VISSVAAILTVGDGYALQLRDHLPAIAFPGHWGLFGGAVDQGETPVAAVRREVVEELALDVVQWDALWEVPYRCFFDGHPCVVAIFTADLTGRWGDHVLREGRAGGVFRDDRLPSPMIPMAASLLARFRRERGNIQGVAGLSGGSRDVDRRSASKIDERHTVEEA
jgi:8-oxo-dGTP pyrophosphatase MutT (NUDIX family)